MRLILLLLLSSCAKADVFCLTGRAQIWQDGTRIDSEICQAGRCCYAFDLSSCSYSIRFDDTEVRNLFFVDGNKTQCPRGNTK